MSILKKINFRAILNGFSALTILLAFITISYFSYLQYTPFTIIDSYNVEVLTHTVTHSQFLKVKFNYCKRENFPAKVQVYIRDGIYFLYGEYNSNEGVGCYTQTQILRVPTALESGYYSIEVKVTYEVTPIRNITYMVKSNIFEIVK